MFESICIGRQDFSGGPVDFGRLAEALVFYREVHFLAEQETFKSLVRTCGSDVVLELCRLGTLKIYFCENVPAVATADALTPAEKHALVTVKVNNHNYLTFATKFFEEYIGPSGKGFNRTLRHFSKYVIPYEIPRVALDHVQSDLTEREYLRSSVKGILASLTPTYAQPHQLLFDVTLLGDGHFQVGTNVNFGEANRAYREHVPASDSSLSKAYILAQLLGTRTNLEKASSLSSDLSLGPVSSIIGANKIASILKSHETSRKALERFTEWVVNDSRAIGHAVETRQRSFPDVLALVRQAQKFKEWLKRQD